jgi:signal recognition particle receptor subunit alpha
VFVKLFEPFLVSFLASLHANKSIAAAAVSPISWNFAKALEGWDAAFNQLLRGFEDKAAQVSLV